MFTLHIEHMITDFPTWKGAFDRFSDARSQAGVRASRIRRPVDDSRYVVIDLDFETKEQAEAFRTFLTGVIWSNPDNAPGLAGTPTSTILEPVPSGT